MLPFSLNVFYVFSLVMVSMISALGQQPYPVPFPAQPLSDPVLERERISERDWQMVRKHLDKLDSLGKFPVYGNTKPPTGPPAVLLLQYKRSSAQEIELLAPEREDRTKFTDLLKRKNTGMMKLVMDLGCDEFSIKIPTGNICEQFSMPGGGSAYSFRQKDYQMWKLADLLYDGKTLTAFGQMSLGFMVDLGNIPLDSVTKDTKGVGSIYSFDPTGALSDAYKQNKQFVDGYDVDGFTYKKYLPAIEGETYVMRSCAYNGIASREDKGFKYNELDHDKRSDVIVGFRIVKKDFNGTLTIVWKILQSKPSPTLR